jgi:hypothetical protein
MSIARGALKLGFPVGAGNDLAIYTVEEPRFIDETEFP